jgi:hypothetical protein
MKRGRTSRVEWALASLALLAASCVVSPQPIPPADEPELDGDGISVFDNSAEDAIGLISFTAAPETVFPAEGQVIVTNLETGDAPSFVSVASDGSFSVALVGAPTDVIRFQVKQAVRSQPVDLRIDATAESVEIVEDTPSCFVIEPARYAPLEGAGDSVSLVLRNECDANVRIDSPRLRRGQASFTFSPTSSFTIEPGSASFITVQRADSDGEVEDVLLLDVIEPEPTRRAITLSIPDP